MVTLGRWAIGEGMITCMYMYNSVTNHHVSVSLTSVMISLAISSSTNSMYVLRYASTASSTDVTSCLTCAGSTDHRVCRWEESLNRSTSALAADVYLAGNKIVGIDLA